jgi:hypothetical protein
MANRDNPRGFEWAGNLYGGTGGPRVITYKLKASSIVSAGDPLILASGYMDIAATTSGKIFGVAAEDGDATDAVVDIDVIPALPGYLFRANASGSPAQANIGALCDIEASGGTGAYEVNENASTESTLMIVDIVRDGNVTLGETNGDLLVRFVRGDFCSSDVAL